ncbi:MAG: ABC transporter substrate-binding protein, partial [Erysipelotrichaceae bacterium]|nr:ABC transporter substrate-binding protein [Erysipelotrichaceae bacterium]
DIDAVNSIANFWIMSDSQYPYSKGNLGKYKTDTQNPIGSNGYILKGFDKAAGATLAKNDKCFEKDEYKVDKIIVKTIEGATELEVLQKGEINLLPEILESSVIGPASTDPNIAYTHYFRAGCAYMGFNCKSGPTSDVKVRQALSYAVDRASFVDAFYKYPEASEEVSKIKLGYVPTLFWSPVAEGLGAYITGEEKLEGLQVYDYNPEKAKQLLEEAGWKVGEDGIRQKDGQKLTIRYLQLKDSASADMLMPIVMKSWKDIGVELIPSITEFNTIVTMLENFEDKEASGWDAFYLGMQFLNTSNTIMNRQLGYSGSASDPVYLSENYARIVDEQLNEALEQGKNTTDTAVSVEAYKKAAIRESELAPYVSVYGNQFFDLYSNKVKNLKTGPLCTWSQAMKGVVIE